MNSDKNRITSEKKIKSLILNDSEAKIRIEIKKAQDQSKKINAKDTQSNRGLISWSL